MAMIMAAGNSGTFEGFTVDIADGILTLSLDRPAQGNALPSAAVPQLESLFRAANARDDVRVLLMRGEGPSFCVGGDVKGFAQTIDTPPEARHADYYGRMDRARLQIEAFLDLSCPVIVACQGVVAGAAVAYPLGADIALAEPGTRFVFAHQRLGLPPDGGLTYLLPRIVGVRKASELALTAATLDSAEALRIGIVSRIVDAETLQEDARQVARRIAAAPRGAVRRARGLLRASLGRTASEQLAAERDAIADSVAEPDFEEGVRAFIEKRRAIFPSTRE